MLVVFVSIAASECFALFFCLSCKNNQKKRSRTTRGAVSPLPINERKEKEKTLEQPIPPNAKHTLDGGM